LITEFNAKVRASVVNALLHLQVSEESSLGIGSAKQEKFHFIHGQMVEKGEERIRARATRTPILRMTCRGLTQVSRDAIQTSRNLFVVGPAAR
jgi:hypothetical protein